MVKTLGNTGDLFQSKFLVIVFNAFMPIFQRKYLIVLIARSLTQRGTHLFVHQEVGYKHCCFSLAKVLKQFDSQVNDSILQFNVILLYIYIL